MDSDKKTYQQFNYTNSDFNFVVRAANPEESNLDVIIEEKWKKAEQNKLFRYDLDIKNLKRIGKNGEFIVQSNPERFQARRKPQDIQSMDMAFDAERFNFTRIDDREILFDVGAGDGDNVVAINISPLEFRHCLFLPHRLKCLPQIPTEFSVVKIVELCLLSKSSFMRGVFNSLCAHASVNHLHWHLFYLKHRMFLESIDLHKLSDKLFMIKETDYPAKGFCIKLSSFNNDASQFAKAGYKIIHCLQTHKVAYNVFITRALSSMSPESDIFDDLRMYIWPRKTITGIKVTTTFYPAASELFGLITVENQSTVDDLTGSYVSSVLTDVTSHTFNQVESHVVELFNQPNQNV